MKQNQLKLYIEFLLEKNNDLKKENLILRKKIVIYIILFL